MLAGGSVRTSFFVYHEEEEQPLLRKALLAELRDLFETQLRDEAQRVTVVLGPLRARRQIRQAADLRSTKGELLLVHPPREL